MLEIGKVSGSAPRTWRTIYLVPTYHYLPMHPKGGDPKPHHLHCKKAYLSSHSGVRRAAQSKALLRDHHPPSRIANVRQTTPNVREDMEKPEF